MFESKIERIILSVSYASVLNQVSKHNLLVPGVDVDVFTWDNFDPEV